MKKIFCVLIFALIFLPTVVSATTLHPTGLIWDTPETIKANILKLPASFYSSSLPPSVNLRDYFPEPGNQGRQLSCSAWAVAYALRSQMEGLEQIFSPAYVYNQINGGFDRGSAITHAMRVIVNQGVTSIESFPYCEFDFLTQPTVEQREEAAHSRMRTFGVVRGRNEIKRVLANGGGVVIGVNVFPDFDRISENNPVYSEVYGTHRGGHAITLIGYCDDMGENGAFKFINSWGTDWGLNGYGWISYELMDDSRVNHHNWTLGEALGYVMIVREPSVIYEAPFDYTVSNGEATIVRHLEFSEEVIIPRTLGGYPVTAIADRAFEDEQDNSRITRRVVIPNSVTQIGHMAFFNSVHFESVTIPESVTRIGNNAFHLFDLIEGRIVPLSNLTILCYENSFAHNYAKQNNFPLGLFNPSLWGDVNGDGILNAADVTLMRRFFNKPSDVEALRRILAS